MRTVLSVCPVSPWHVTCSHNGDETQHKQISRFATYFRW